MPYLLDSNRITEKRGVIGLLTVIILGAIILAVGLAAAYSAQTDLLLIADADRAQYARNLADSCLDEALYRLKKDDTYTGGTVPLSENYECTVTVAGTGGTRTIQASATDGESTKTIQVGAERRANSQSTARTWYVTSWTEVDP